MLFCAALCCAMSQWLSGSLGASYPMPDLDAMQCTLPKYTDGCGGGHRFSNWIFGVIDLVMMLHCFSVIIRLWEMLYGHVVVFNTTKHITKYKPAKRSRLCI